MSDEHARPDPDALLAAVQTEEPTPTRGKLKIFLGYAAGVGKTYAMLEAARQRQAEGVEVVAAYVETHGRAETAALLAGLEVVPHRQVPYRGTEISELDVDAVLARRPHLALVDELAHSNAPGSRHLKRYQDVEELLAAGIHVYTTLNIQHLESLNDVVAQITGVVVRETIPDRVMDEAAEIELIDLPPQELISRLREGKVYVPAQAARASEQFFRLGNLTALRELALRRAAERVDDQMRAYMRARAIAGPWPATERLLVCISPSPIGDRVVRAGRRLASEMNAEWLALHVDPPGSARLSQAERDRVARTLRLAQELGAQAVTLPGPHVAEGIVHYARQHNVTQIIIGKSLRPRWRRRLQGSLADQIIHESGDIDVHIVGGQTDEEAPQPADGTRRSPLPWRRYLGSTALVVLVTLLGQPFHHLINPTNLVMLYLVAVVVAAMYLGRGPAAWAALLSVVAFDYFFVPPRLTLAVSDSEYILTFVGLLIVGLVISGLTAQTREQADAARQRATEATVLYELSRDLATAADLPVLLQVAINRMSQHFGRAVAIFLPQGGSLEASAASLRFALDANELAVAAWVFRQGEPAGHGTGTLAAATAHYLPLRTARGVVGVLGVMPTDPAAHLTPEQQRLLQAFTHQVALAVERAQLAEQWRQAQLVQATETLQAALLNSISHDLRTPLVSITGALSSLHDDAEALDSATRQSLVATAYEEAGRLNRLVGNLLDMTRLEAGAMRLRCEPCDVQDVIGSALEQLRLRLQDRSVVVDTPPDLPLVPLDFVLMVQALANLLDNACKYSPPGGPITVQARQVEDDRLEITVTDAGRGIPPDDLERIFRKFYRAPQADGIPGSGLGLTISRGIVEAHGGRIRAANRPAGGAVFTITLPLAAPREVDG